MKRRVGVLDVCAYPAPNLWEAADGLVSKKSSASVIPQAIAVWCRQAGHRVHYASYVGFGDPLDKLPTDLDVVFFCAHSYLAPFAYALAKLFRIRGVLTVIGGPHARSYPEDCLRFFDLVVLECDEALIERIVRGDHRPGSVVSSAEPFADTPTLAERMPYIESATFIHRRPHRYTLVPLLASTGCPYRCDFCTDWASPYRRLPGDRLAEDLRFASEKLPGVFLVFHDPNFGARFSETLSVFERIPRERRSPYLVESSLSNLRPDRLRRLRESNCVGLAPGIESWNAYAEKSGVRGLGSAGKLDRLVDQMQALHEEFPIIQANFVFGLDSDSGPAPFELTKEFLLRTPFVWPMLNMPKAFGGTPLFDRLLREGRLLTALPFTFYINPYLSLVPKHYEPVEFLEHMTDLYALATSGRMLRRRWSARLQTKVKVANLYRTLVEYPRLRFFRALLRRLRSDRAFQAFHRGESAVLPSLYASIYRDFMGRYAELVPVEESRPVHLPLMTAAASSSASACKPGAGGRSEFGSSPSRNRPAGSRSLVRHLEEACDSRHHVVDDLATPLAVGGGGLAGSPDRIAGGDGDG